MKPIIGITIDESGYLRGLQSKINSGYGHAISAAGATPLLLQIMHSPKEHAETIAKTLDGLVITGGESNIYPLLCGSKISEHTDYLYPLRDYWEHELIRAFIKENKPIMGICRGMQQLNVFFGGDLYFNLHKEVEGSAGHWAGDTPMKYAAHSIEILEKTRFFDIAGSDSALVNSFHYQAIDKLAKDLKVSAYSEDKIIEAIEHIDAEKYISGYQFHPEMMVDDNLVCKRIFTDFIENISARKES
ncbi:gamma-glutamyl-gamma-aminobutyrate hydrolase family protein [Pelagibaculum spongiae]|uniref:Uncharacterized protein n=1 Tax=Pelagibaculum spongiae TaxID=2080658 RepID=A0A2V1GW62_9GAMM|nr:gamma-glutamyl-gamma-aminobutyrate hydrolase family protein [Pelagibaculum spongiae]PVZ70645.1 hypothetical protein DC094_08695 [Pelagibaculum spongiae]